MTKFKIEYDPSYTAFKYKIYREEKTLFSTRWVEINSQDSLEKAEAAINELKKYPKYYEV